MNQEDRKDEPGMNDRVEGDDVPKTRIGAGPRAGGRDMTRRIASEASAFSRAVGDSDGASSEESGDRPKKAKTHGSIEFDKDGSERTIRSYVKRVSHNKEHRIQAIDKMAPKFGIELSMGLLDYRELFGNDHPVILEIGFGMGVTTAQMAKAMPDRNFIGVEVHTPGVGNLYSLMDRQDITNIRVHEGDAIDALKILIPDESLEGAHVYFPDPWPKKRHHKRRLVQAPFVKMLMAKLRRGGYLHFATDWADYADWMSEILLAEPGLRTDSDDPTGRSPRPSWRPLTKFEGKGLKKGHEIADFIFTKV